MVKACPTIQGGAVKQKKIRLKDLLPKEGRSWDTHRAQAETVTTYYADGGNYPRLAERMNGCCNWLEYRLLETSLEFNKAFFCRCRYCPGCQLRVSMKWSARTYKILPNVLADHSNARWLLLTLTIKNVDISNLRETIKKMNYGFKKLTLRKDWPGIGWIKSMEITKGQNGPMMAHPHFHVLMMVKPSYYWARNYMSTEQWGELWASCMDLDYMPQVNVQAIKGNLEQAIQEVLKYETKPTDIIGNGIKWLEALTQQTFKTRRIEVAGVLRPYYRELEEERQGDDQGPGEEEDQPCVGDKFLFNYDRPDQTFVLDQELD